MIELTEEQLQAVDASKPKPMIAVDPRTSTPYIIVRKDIFERLSDASYDDSPWTDEERDLLASEVDAMLDDDMAIEDPAL